MRSPTRSPRGDLDDLRDELGDLLLQVVFHARMAQEAGRFGFGDVVQAITEKLIRRHPHVFGDARDLYARGGEAAVGRDQGRGEGGAGRSARRRRRGPRGRVGRSAGRAPCPHPRAQAPGEGRQGRLRLERSARGAREDPRGGRRDFGSARAGDRAGAAAETGDLLFAVVNLARHLDADPEATLRATNAKFERRFAFIEDALAARGKAPAQSTLEEMDALVGRGEGGREGCAGGSSAHHSLPDFGEGGRAKRGRVGSAGHGR